MNRSEAAMLLGHCAAFDNRTVGKADATAWASALHNLPYDDDTLAAVARFYGTPPKDPSQKLWIQPHNVRTLRKTIRSERLENFQYEPVGEETPGEFIARYRGQLNAIASGRVAPPTGRLALTGGPHKDVADALEAGGIGRSVPNSDEETLAESVQRAGPLGIRCPACGAAIGRPCKTPGGSEKHFLGKPRRPHSARLRAASGEPGLTPEQQAAEEERRREMSRRKVADLRAEADPMDAEIVEDAS